MWESVRRKDGAGWASQPERRPRVWQAEGTARVHSLAADALKQCDFDASYNLCGLKFSYL